MSTQAQIEVTYDVCNDFFRLWLDRDMSYSCALFEGTTSLELAQRNKLRWICEAARVTRTKRVLDIGCGWGAALQFLVRDLEVEHATGITLSTGQYDEVLARDLPRVDVHLTDYRDFVPGKQFDAVISIGMFEHIATPQ